MSIPQPATDDAWRQTLERLGAHIHWLGKRDPWVPRHQHTGQCEGTAARDALRALNRMSPHDQPFPLIHIVGTAPGQTQ